MIDGTKIHNELVTLAASYKDSGFGKLADRLISFADRYKSTPLAAAPAPISAPTTVATSSAAADSVMAPVSVLPKVAADVSEDDGTDEEWEGVDTFGDDDVGEAEDEEVEAMEDIDEDIAMRDACTKLCRAAKVMGSHPNPNIRSLSKRINKVERLLRTVL